MNELTRFPTLSRRQWLPAALALAATPLTLVNNTRCSGHLVPQPGPGAKGLCLHATTRSDYFSKDVALAAVYHLDLAPFHLTTQSKEMAEHPVATTALPAGSAVRLEPSSIQGEKAHMRFLLARDPGGQPMATIELRVYQPPANLNRDEAVGWLLAKGMPRIPMDPSCVAAVMQGDLHGKVQGMAENVPGGPRFSIRAFDPGTTAISLDEGVPAPVPAGGVPGELEIPLGSWEFKGGPLPPRGAEPQPGPKGADPATRHSEGARIS